MRRGGITLVLAMSLLVAACATTQTNDSGVAISGEPTVSFADAMDLFNRACGADLQQYCKDAHLGGGEIRQCLANNSANLSSQCQSTYTTTYASLERRVAAQAAVPAACEGDARRLCSEFRQGQARVLRCLIREDNARRVSRGCNAAITQAGWR